MGEFGLIRALTGRFEQGPQVYVGPGDDAAVLRTPKGHVVVSTDLLVEGRHFRREWAPARDIGRKAAAANLSDVNAMGGTRALAHGRRSPRPPTCRCSWALDLADGIAEEAGLVGAEHRRRRPDHAPTRWWSRSRCSAPARSHPVLRSGAGPGDVVALAGRQGWAAAGLAVLARGFRSPRALVEAYQRPEPPYAAGSAAATAGATAMIDVSDGLLADLGHLAADSGVADRRRPRAPSSSPSRCARSAPRWAWTRCSSSSAAATTTRSSRRSPPDVALPEGFTRIGVVSEPETGPVVTLDGAAYDGPSGWSHF